MSKNHMEEVAKLLGVELEEDFRIKGICADLLFRITEGGVCSHHPRSGYGELSKLMLTQLLTGDSEIIRLPWKPKMNEEYHIPCIGYIESDMATKLRWRGNKWDNVYYQFGLVCKTREEAIAMAKKMIAVVQEDKDE
mgnify:CR=1 FL=1